MHMMPKKKSMLLPVWYKNANLVLNKTISIINKIASTTIIGIILNHTTLHALAISHHPAISMHLATQLPHTQISIYSAHNTYKPPSIAIHHKTLIQPHHMHTNTLALYATIVIVLVM